MVVHVWKGWEMLLAVTVLLALVEILVRRTWISVLQTPVLMVAPAWRDQE